MFSDLSLLISQSHRNAQLTRSLLFGLLLLAMLIVYRVYFGSSFYSSLYRFLSRFFCLLFALTSVIPVAFGLARFDYFVVALQD